VGGGGREVGALKKTKKPSKGATRAENQEQKLLGAQRAKPWGRGGPYPSGTGESPWGTERSRAVAKKVLILVGVEDLRILTVTSTPIIKRLGGGLKCFIKSVAQKH